MLRKAVHFDTYTGFSGKGLYVIYQYFFFKLKWGIKNFIIPSFRIEIKYIDHILNKFSMLD